MLRLDRLVALVALAAVAACSAPAPVSTASSTAPPETVIVPPPSVPIATGRPVPAKPRTLPLAMREELRAEASSIDDAPSALFRKAIEREDAQDLTAARKLYFDLIMQHPKSPLVPYCYLAFGEIFFEEAENDAPDKWALAKQAYEEVTKYPPPLDSAHAYALLRMAAVLNRSKDSSSALGAARKALVDLAANPKLPLNAETADAARRELVIAYAASALPARALAFFRSTDPVNVLPLTLLLIDEYVRTDHLVEAVGVTQIAMNELKGAEPNSALCQSAATTAKKLAASGAEADRRALKQLVATASAICEP